MSPAEVVEELNDFIRENPKPFVRFEARVEWGEVMLRIEGFHMNKAVNSIHRTPPEVLAWSKNREEIYGIMMERMYTEVLREMFVFEGWRRDD